MGQDVARFRWSQSEVAKRPWICDVKCILQSTSRVVLATVRLCVVSKQSAAPIRGQPGSWAIVKSCIQSSICSNLKHSQHGWRRLCTCSPIHEVREAQNASNTGGPTKFNAGHVTHIPIMIRLRQCSAPPHSRRCTPRAASARGLKLSLLSCRF